MGSTAHTRCFASSCPGGIGTSCFCPSPHGRGWREAPGEGRPLMVTAEVSEQTSRLEAFSDGIFAIAMTLLVLEIRLPENIPPGTLGSALLHLWKSYLAFLTSFATIGVMWVNHHRIFNLIRRTDQGVLTLNLLLMLGVTFLPFPTAVVARNIRSVDARTAVLFYNGTFTVIAICWGVLWRYAVRNRHLM